MAYPESQPAYSVYPSSVVILNSAPRDSNWYSNKCTRIAILRVLGAQGRAVPDEEGGRAASWAWGDAVLLFGLGVHGECRECWLCVVGGRGAAAVRRYRSSDSNPHGTRARGGNELINQAEEDRFPRLIGEQAHDQLPARLHNLRGNRKELIHERAELQAQDLLLLRLVLCLPAVRLRGSLSAS